MTAQLTLGDFAPQYDPSKGQWHTPQWLARRMVQWSGVGPGMRVLEPSAGGGAIVRELLAAGATVDAIEIDPAWVAHLAREFTDVVTIAGDALGFVPTERGLDEYDLAVMNPPLDGGVGPEHIAHALKFAPRAVSILRAVDLHGVERQKLWRAVALAGVAWLIRRPTFGGESSGGAQADFVVVDVRREFTGSPTLEWW